MGPRVGIVGCGRMGAACAELLWAGGLPLLLTSRHAANAARVARRLPGAIAAPLDRVARDAEVIVLATPVQATCAEIAPRIRCATAGKPVIDVSNPTCDDSPSRPNGGASAAERIAAALPGSAIVKALNCVSAKTLPFLARRPPIMTVPIAGDDPEAKWLVRWLLAGVGVDVADAGALRSSRWIEGLAALLMTLGNEADSGDVVGFRLVRLPVAEGVAAAPGPYAPPPAWGEFTGR